MALNHKGVHFTRWTHVENGNVMNRRLHRIEVQANDGRLHVITGDRLPDFIQTNAGNGHSGKHIAQILLDPNRRTSSVIALESGPWPAMRDGVNLAIGFASFVLLRFALSAFGLI